MTQNVRFGLLAIIILVFIWLMMQISALGKSNEALAQDIISLETKASHYAMLKKRWHKKSLKTKVLAQLEQIKTFDKHFKKNSHDVIVYKGLTRSLLDRLSYTLFASDIILVDVKIEKESERINLEAEIR